MINEEESQIIDLTDLQLPQMPKAMREFGDRANVIDQTDPEKMTAEFKHILRGEEKDDEGKWVIPEKHEPILNEYGINKMATFMRMIINKNTIFTKYSTDEIRRILVDIETDVNNHIRANATKYEITPQNYLIVVDMIIQPIEAAINRSREGITMDFIGNVTKDINQNADMRRQQPMYPMQNPGFISKTLNKFNPFK